MFVFDSCFNIACKYESGIRKGTSVGVRHYVIVPLFLFNIRPSHYLRICFLIRYLAYGR